MGVGFEASGAVLGVSLMEAKGSVRGDGQWSTSEMDVGVKMLVIQWWLGEGMVAVSGGYGGGLLGQREGAVLVMGVR
ncbi:hypothetical protein V6N12_019590 [Hibiscus sabdariffa]|uniref:Uncharacterized protein n=1 Tax=Hibiscus sabdariffa TaxID=183260 RepID=A0ABR1ZJC7_9ROSI